MRRFVIFLFVYILTFSQVHANTLTVYDCPNNTLDYVSCSKACVKHSLGLSSRFNINVDKDLVMVTTFLKGVEISSTMYNNCTVIDKRNFICNYKNLGVAQTSGKLNMSEGKISNSFWDNFNEKNVRYCYK